MLFAIAGVTGNTGSVVANTLLDQGHQVRVIVRDAAKAAPFAARGASVAVADLGDTAALTEALRGADGAYVLVPPNMATPDFRAYQKATGESIAAAAAASGLPHIVLLSSFAAQLPSGTGPIAGLHPLEAALRALPHTHVSVLRAGYFMENLLGSFGMLDQGLLPSFLPADLPLPLIASKDIGAVAAELLANPPTGGSRTIELGGPERSTAEIAGVLSGILGRTVTVHVAPVEVMADTLAGYGMPRQFAELYAEMTGAILRGEAKWEGIGRREGTTSLESFLAGVLAR